MASDLWRIQSKSYAGLAMRCAPGTHEAAMAMLQRRGVSAGSVLDLASGSGALLARLRDHNWSPLAAAELDGDKFQVEGIKPMPLDLNADFADRISQTFSLVTAIEIIEHLDSPRHFLSEARKLLTPTSLLLLSTPNVTDRLGRIKFLLTGTLRNFDDTQYRYNRHVSPLPPVQLRHLLAEVGLEVVEQVTAGSFFGPMKQLALSPIWIWFQLIAGPETIGDVRLYLLRATEPTRSLAGDWTRQSG